MSKERNTRSVRYTGTNFVVVGAINVEGLVALLVERVVFLVVAANECVDVPAVLPGIVLMVVE